jgi:hypothetical protein
MLPMSQRTRHGRSCLDYSRSGTRLHGEKAEASVVSKRVSSRRHSGADTDLDRRARYSVYSVPSFRLTHRLGEKHQWAGHSLAA